MRSASATSVGWMRVCPAGAALRESGHATASHAAAAHMCVVRTDWRRMRRELMARDAERDERGPDARVPRLRCAALRESGHARVPRLR